MDKLLEALRSSGIPFAYHHFAEGETAAPPFVCYLLPSSRNCFADDKVYQQITEVHIELYTDRKSFETEQQLEYTLDSAGFCYNKTEVWIESEQLYEVLYTFEMEVK